MRKGISMKFVEQIRLQSKYRFTGWLVFETAFRIGSGRAGESGSDLGVLLDPQGVPILPGSSLKGKFRSTVERLSYLLGMSACLLDRDVSQVNCVSDVQYFHQVNDQLKGKSCKERYEWVGPEPRHHKQVCDVCWLFGSPLSGSRIFFQDGSILKDDNKAKDESPLKELDARPWNNVIERRDGVVIDRDSERARDSLKYDFEVVPARTTFEVNIEVENPSDAELALFAIGLNEWQEGIRLGGGVSRGLGFARLHAVKMAKVDFSDPAACLAYCLERKMQDVTLEDLTAKLREQLQPTATPH